MPASTITMLTIELAGVTGLRVALRPLRRLKSVTAVKRSELRDLSSFVSLC
jgi:hypothetical protein